MAEKRTALTVDHDMVAKARMSEIDTEQVAERERYHTLRLKEHETSASDREHRWKQENRDALEAANKYHQEHGFPFPQSRRF